MTTSEHSGAAATPEVPIVIDDVEVSVASGTTILDAARTVATDDTGSQIPTLCYGDTIRPKNACRICMVEVEGSRSLVPACSRVVEAGMVIRTRSERVDHSRKMVLEFLGSSVDLSLTEHIDDWNAEYDADPDRYGTVATRADEPVIDDNPLYVRDYAKCILCYQCVDACGDAWQHSYVIDIAGRGFESRVATEFEASLPEADCVFCGNCIQVCPTGALMFRSEHTMRQDGSWRPDDQTTTDTICGYCGVGCNLTLHVQDNAIVKVTSPSDSPITHGNLCIKGRFGFQHAQPRPAEVSPTDPHSARPPD